MTGKLTLFPVRGRRDIDSRLTTVPLPRMMDGVWNGLLESGGSFGGGDGNVIGATVDI